MARWFVVTVALLFIVCVHHVEAQKKKGKPKTRRVADRVKDLESNVTLLWHEVDMLQQPVHVHIHGHDGELMHDHHHDDHIDHYHEHDDHHHDVHDHDHDHHHYHSDKDMPMSKKDKDDTTGMVNDSRAKKDKKYKKGKKHGHHHDDDDDKNGMGKGQGHKHHGDHDHHDDDDDHHGHHHHDRHHHMGRDDDDGMHRGHMGHMRKMGNKDHDDMHKGHGHMGHMGRMGHMDHMHGSHGDHEGMHHGGHGAHVHIHLHTGAEEKDHEDVFFTDVPMDEYMYARCDVVPNFDLEESQQHKELMGSIYFRQKPKNDLQVSVNVSGFNVDHSTPEGQKHRHVHGMHAHEFGDTSNGCTKQGGHYNPHNTQHGGEDSSERHPGDFGNLKVDELGHASVMFNDTMASLFGPHSLLGRGIVIHAGEDDLGLGGTEASLKSGNAGARIACCAIVATPPRDDVWPAE